MKTPTCPQFRAELLYLALRIRDGILDGRDQLPPDKYREFRQEMIQRYKAARKKLILSEGEIEREFEKKRQALFFEFGIWPSAQGQKPS